MTNSDFPKVPINQVACNFQNSKTTVITWPIFSKAKTPKRSLSSNKIADLLLTLQKEDRLLDSTMKFT